METKWKYGFVFLLLVALVVWLSVYAYPKENLKLVACDVGQGDAILAIYGKTQFLIDGGPNDDVLSCLSKYMPFWDRNIELVVLTHPDSDHLKGLIEVFERYEVNLFLTNSLDPGSQEFKVLEKVVGGTNTHVIPPKEGMVIGNSKMHLEVVYPTEAIQEQYLTKKEEDNSSKVLGTTTSSRKTNDFSIVSNLESGNFKALLTGDITPGVMDEVLATGKIGKVDYIKIPHHGSKNGLTEELLDKTMPKVAIISVGKNSWGHPNKEILEMLEKYNIEVLRTDEMGDVVINTPK
ncbi:ComEC/Rec2 family competence protein [Patescibacteria group bacterium]